MSVLALRPVKVEFSIQEARAVAAAVDMAIAFAEGVHDEEGKYLDLAILRKRLLQGVAVAEDERRLGL